MRYRLLAMLCVGTVIAYLQRSALGVPAKRIQGELGIDPAVMGLVMSGWYALYAAGQLPAGWLADRWGSKPALVLYAVLWSALTGIVGLATGFLGLLLIWSLMGAAQAGIFPCATKAIRATFSPTGRAFASGSLTCCMAMGAALAQVATAELLGELTWQTIFALYAIIGLTWVIAFALLIPPPEQPDPTDKPPDGAATPPPQPLPPIRWSKLVTDAQMVLLCLQQFFRAGAMVFFFTWFPQYLQESRGVSELEAGGLAAWPCVGGMLGGLLGGSVSDWLLLRTGNRRLSRQGLAFVAMMMCTGLALAAYFVADPGWAVFLISLGAFWGYFGGVSGYSLAIQYGGRRVATVFATMNMSGNIGAMLFPFLVGRLVKSTGNWDSALLLFVAMFAAGAVCWAVLNPKGTLFGGEDDHS